MKYYHFRVYSREKSAKIRNLETKGGVTIGVEQDNTGFHILVARCSTKDNYSKKIGRLAVDGRLDLMKNITYVPVEPSVESLRKFATKEFKSHEYNKVKRMLANNGILALKGEMKCRTQRRRKDTQAGPTVQLQKDLEDSSCGQDSEIGSLQEAKTVTSLA